jgi:hypothetical protein
VHPKRLTAAPAHFLGDGTDVRRESGRESGASIGGGAALPSLANEPDASEAARFNGVGTPLGRAELAAEVVLLLPTLRGESADESVDETVGRGERAGARGESAAEAPAPPVSAVVSAPRGDLVGTGMLLPLLGRPDLGFVNGSMLLGRPDLGFVNGSLAAPELPTACASGDGGRPPLSRAVVLLVLSLLPESAVAGGLGESSSGFVTGGSSETAAASLDL